MRESLHSSSYEDINMGESSCTMRLIMIAIPTSYSRAIAWDFSFCGLINLEKTSALKRDLLFFLTYLFIYAMLVR
mgnify:FL=1